ncbi:DNA-packaging protein [Photorhabdus laumondii subsp. laumondii]|uniref:phage tail protein n=1 Tax=Photorhabdus TaxID=29487 RepID=UPI000DCEACEA|nr:MULTISPECIES: phage tail protein [Photorhabdus]NDK93231.1 DNA-packaging protein [Photorhabdus laumondii subsp. laumondii]NDL28616.1 DNA-packaging protein [Photorhabdus laumondii subsp. laumondii]NDL33191.1 DNA-packaging protein [Photorhabdus laumondii subsp. laumondii]RAW79553.1 DNA-packaging protein [Photorhabdus sp. S15-56]
MSHKNDFKAFSISSNANVISQAKYEQNLGLQVGFSPDNVPTHLLNKVLRQSSTISSVVADFIATQSGNDILDDGNVAKLTAQLNKAIAQKITTDMPNASLTQKGVVQLTNVIGNSDTLAVTQKLVQQEINSLREHTYTREEIDNRIKTVGEIPVGSPIPWPLPYPPVGYLTCNGSAFNKLQYPKLAEAYPDGRLPDLRGEFIRGWDDGRGVDMGRTMLSWQGDAMQRMTGFLEAGNGIGLMTRPHDSTSGVFLEGDLRTISHVTQNGTSYAVSFDSSRVARTANETRPRNIAFNYVVRAA